MSRKPLILVTNDDGISALGSYLIQIMNTIGDVVVVAPDSPQSGWDMITINSTLRCTKVKLMMAQKEYLFGHTS